MPWEIPKGQKKRKAHTSTAKTPCWQAIFGSFYEDTILKNRHF
jgi:hypothetical protein